MVKGEYILYTSQLPGTAGEGIVSMNDHSTVPCDGRDYDVVFLVGSVEFTTGNTKCVSAAELMTTRSALKNLTGNSTSSGIRVYFNNVPYLVHRYYGVESLPIGFIDVTRLYRFFANPEIMNVIDEQLANAVDERAAMLALADLLKKFNNQINSNLEIVTSYNYKDLIRIFQESHEIYTGKSEKSVVVDDLLMNEIRDGYVEYNSRRRKVRTFEYVSSAEVKQDVESSPLWFYIPTLAQLRISGGAGLKPSWEFGNHYTSQIFRNDLYMIFLENDWSKIEFLQYCKTTTNDNGRGTLFSRYGAEDENAFLEHEPMEVAGNPENNLLPIQENEQAIKLALTNMVKASIVEMLEERGDEATDERVERLYAANVIPGYVNAYLNSLVEFFLQMNWAHTGKVPQLFDETEENEDDSDEEGDKFYGYVISQGRSLEGFNPTDAIQLLTSELFTQARTLGVDLYIDTIIRLARWGVRKPTRVEIGGNRYLDLNRMTIDYDNGMRKIAAPELKDGKYLLDLNSVIVAQGNGDVVRERIADFKAERFKIPVGFVCTMETDGEPIWFALSLMEIMQLLTDQKCADDFVFMYSAPKPEQMVRGLSIVGEQLEVEPLADLEEVSLPYIVSNIVAKNSALKTYLTAPIKEFCLKAKISVAGSYLSALQKFLKEENLEAVRERLYFTSMADLKKKLFSGSTAYDCLHYMLFEAEWSLLVQALVSQNTGSSEEFLQIFFQSFKNEFKGDMAFLAEAQVEAQSDTKGDEDDMIKETILGNFASLGSTRYALRQDTNTVGVVSIEQTPEGKIYVISTNSSDISALEKDGSMKQFLTVAKVKATYLKQVFAYLENGKVPAIRFVDAASLKGFVDL